MTPEQKLREALRAIVFHNDKHGSSLPVPIIDMARAAITTESGWMPIETAPKDGTPFIGAFWSIRWSESHRRGEIVRCWWQPEFDAFISSCREMTMHNGYTFEDGSTRQLHSPVIEPITHWRELLAPPASPASGGES